MKADLEKTIILFIGNKKYTYKLDKIEEFNEDLLNNNYLYCLRQKYSGKYYGRCWLIGEYKDLDNPYYFTGKTIYNYGYDTNKYDLLITKKTYKEIYTDFVIKYNYCGTRILEDVIKIKGLIMFYLMFTNIKNSEIARLIGKNHTTITYHKEDIEVLRSNIRNDVIDRAYEIARNINQTVKEMLVFRNKFIVNNHS